MNFSLYDLLSQIIPGGIIYFALLRVYGVEWDKDYAIVATLFALLIGYYVNALSSWVEQFYFWTWGGKPSSRLLKGESISSVKFYQSGEVLDFLKKDADKNVASEDELFSIAMYVSFGIKDSRIDVFNANYAFSRNILTACIVIFFILLTDYSRNFNYFFPVIIGLLMAWYRCKERAYYFAREVLHVYLRTQKETKAHKE